MGEEIPALRPVTMAMAQTVALCALGIPPSPHIRSSWNPVSYTHLPLMLMSPPHSSRRMAAVAGIPLMLSLIHI